MELPPALRKTWQAGQVWTPCQQLLFTSFLARSARAVTGMLVWGGLEGPRKAATLLEEVGTLTSHPCHVSPGFLLFQGAAPKRKGKIVQTTLQRQSLEPRVLFASGNGSVFGHQLQHWAREPSGPARSFPCVHTRVCTCVCAHAQNSVGSRDEGGGRCVRPRLGPKVCTLSVLIK